MKFYLGPYLAAIGIAACEINRVDASIARSSFSVAQKPAFGLSAEPISFGLIPRGGAQEADVEEADDVPEVLYLPGLLEASIIKSDKVRYKFCFLMLLVLGQETKRNPSTAYPFDRRHCITLAIQGEGA